MIWKWLTARLKIVSNDSVRDQTFYDVVAGDCVYRSDGKKFVLLTNESFLEFNSLKSRNEALEFIHQSSILRIIEARKQLLETIETYENLLNKKNTKHRRLK